MRKGALFSAAAALALYAAATNPACGQSEQLDAQTAELLELIGGGVEQASFDTASTLDFRGGDLKAVDEKGKVKGGCDSCCGPIWVGGVDVTFFRPHVHGIRNQRSVAEADGVRFDSADYSLDEMTYSPRIWLGKQGECWGLITRFWYLSDSNMFHDPFGGAPLNDLRTATVGNAIKMYTIDLEVNRRLNYRCWDMNLGFGVRHASAAVDTMATQGYSQQTPNNVDYTSSALTKARIDGTGLTIGLDGRRLISPCRNLSMFWGIRTSVLWGESNVQGVGYTSVTNNDVPGDADTAFQSDYLEANDTLFIGEVQLGVLWEQRLSCLPANVFVKLAAEYQFWDSDGDTIWNEAFATTPGGFFGNSQYDANSPSVSLFGLNLGIGLTWGGCCNH